MGLYQSSLRTALTTATFHTSRQHVTYPLLIKQPQTPFPNYSRGYHYESANHSIYVQMPESPNGQVVLPLHPSPFANSKSTQDPKEAFDAMVKEKIGETFDPRLAGLCVDLMKDPDVIDSILKNPAFQNLADDLAVEVSSEAAELLHVPDSSSPSSCGSSEKTSLSFQFEESCCGEKLGSENELPPPMTPNDVEGEERENSLASPLEPNLQDDNNNNNTNNNNNNTNEKLREKEETDKIAEDVVGVVCHHCNQSLPRIDLSKEAKISDFPEDYVGDVVASPPPSPPSPHNAQNMEQVWKSIQSKTDLLSLVLPIVTIAFMVGIMCVRPKVRERVGDILKSSFSKLRVALFAFGPWKRALRR